MTDLPAPGRAGDVPALLAGLLREPGRPRVTWYGPDHERVELSGAVLVNWAVKTTNLLVEELDAGPGTRVLLDLPPHWRALTWALGVWRAGACVVRAGTGGEPADGRPVDVVVTSRPEEHGTGATVVAVALAALARSWPGPLPRGAVDAAAAVMTYPDALGWVPAADPSAPAVAGGPDVPHGELLPTALVAAPPAGARTLQDARALDAVDLALSAAATWAVDGSFVLVDGDALEGAALARVRAGERVTHEAG
ncbi:TIGR03089 family protein [Cellulomonas telluris]|uniref:TIGR03089 family protein n=1 Tax=Cellulomonas telluris TaxID=2306636 RepID=UPI0010A84F1D|nr:TIGR03089 family protein [Cellulomonas telluris]